MALETSVFDLILGEELFYNDCIVVGNKIIGFKKQGKKIELDENIEIDRFDLTHIHSYFSIEINGHTYSGGEGWSHGSFGFFYKRAANGLEWALTATESNPFMQVEFCGKNIKFISDSGQKWIVPCDDIMRVYTE